MDRKEIVRILGEYFKAKPKYMGAPSFEYQIATEEEVYTIDREGNITNSKGEEVEFEKLINGVNEEVNEIEKIEADNPLTVDMEGHTGATLRNLVNMIYSKQTFIQVALDIECELIETEAIEKINEAEIIEIEDFKIALETISEDKYKGLEFDFDKRKIRFNFYKRDIEREKIEVYKQLIALINKKAKELKYASYKVTISDNPKYTFRTWLLRLGMIGEGYKLARKALLANLEGNTAFRSKK